MPGNESPSSIVHIKEFLSKAEEQRQMPGELLNAINNI